MREEGCDVISSAAIAILVLLGGGIGVEAQAQGRMSDEELVRSLDDQERAAALRLVAGQPVKRRFTNIWNKEAGTWRLFVRHANVIPTSKR